MQLAQQLAAAGVRVFPCYANKNPAVPKGTHWASVAEQPPQSLQWPSQLAGVPIPAGVVVIDLDTYKGVTREAVEQHIGTPLPWDQALIQTTGRGGQHYAFRCDWPVRQGSSIGVEGLDTRVAGKGYICTGAGYQPQGFGLYALAHPDSLPELPEATRPTLEHVAPTRPERTAEQDTDTDVQTIRDALVHIDPGCSRSEWLRVGLALRHYFGDNIDEGLSLFDDWSGGLLWQHGEPSNYDPDSTPHQWHSFKPDGGITVATLFYTAIAKGWRPPATFDTAAAFGQGSAAVDVFSDMIDRITEEGGNPKHMDGLVEAIRAMPASPIQRDLLVNALKNELKDAKLLDKLLSQKLDKALRPEAPTVPAQVAPLPDVVDAADIPDMPLSRPTGIHGTNAELMVREIFRDRVAVLDNALRWWSGREWQRLPEEKVFRLATHALKPDQCKAPNISGTVKLLPAVCPNLPSQTIDRRAYFANGVLDMATGELVPHNRNNHNIGAMAVSYNPNAQCPEWFAHMSSLFYGLEDGQQRVDLLQEVIGWLLIRDDLNVQKIVALDGASRGGKGVILEVIQAILGPSKWGAAEFTNLDDGKTQSAFRNSDVMIDMEAEPPAHQTAKRAIGFMNKVASNEVVSIQLLNTQTPWEGKVNAKFIFACNGIPVMIDDSGATTNRFVVLKFDRSFAGKEDRTLSRRLTSEAEGVAAWAVEGLRRLIANGGQFTQPASSTESLDHMKEENQPLRDFIDTNLSIDPAARVHSSDVWAAYRVYAAECNVRLPGRNQFLRSLRQSLIGTCVSEKRSLRIGDTVKPGFEGLTVRSLTTEAFATGLKVVK